MQTRAIHQQIELVAEKILQLNKHLAQSPHILQVEADLLKAYLKELQNLCAALDTAAVAMNEAPLQKPEITHSEPPKHEHKQPEHIVLQEPVTKKEERAKEPEKVTTPVEQVIHVKPEPVIIAEPVSESVKQTKEQIVIKETTITKETTQPAASKKDEKSLNDRFTKTTIEVAEKLRHHVSGKHLKDIISISDKFFYLKELFKNDLNQYEEMIRHLNEMNSFDDAKTYLEQEFSKRMEWEKKEKALEQFTMELVRKFGGK